jgi:hypothetical protein
MTEASVKQRLIDALEAEKSRNDWSSHQQHTLTFLRRRGSGRLPAWVRYEADVRGIWPDNG